MRQQRHTIVTSLATALTAGMLLLAGTAGAQGPPTYESLFQQASAAYGKGDPARCVELFTAAARAAVRDAQAARADFAAAACATAGGDRDGAFALLGQAAAKGYRDVDRATGNPKLEPLRQDPRWQPFLDGVKSRAAARRAKANAEVARICDEDQKDREAGDRIDWSVVGKRDAERLKRTREIAAQGGLKEADDYFCAALVLQHSSETADYEQAHRWCLKALELDPDLANARWLAAATEDRYLMDQGKPQHYGTQYKKVEGKWILWQVDPAVTDEERAKWEVPALAEARGQAETMNPSFAEASDNAADFYEKANWAGCAQQFYTAAAMAPEDRLATRALLRGAGCLARTGQKEGTDEAFKLLDKAVARGCRDADRLATDPDLASLRTDARWKPVFEQVQARAAAARKGPLNPELESLYQADQADRAGDLETSDWRLVEKRDADRRKRVQEIVEKGGAKEAADYVHAAMVFQHGATPEDYDRANRWAAKAVELDPAYPGARWLAAASRDRYLMNSGKPQLYGTQFKRVDGTGPWILWDVDPAITDEERAKWDVPPLARAKARVEALNAGTFQPH
jgi:hypothetical protein